MRFVFDTQPSSDTRADLLCLPLFESDLSSKRGRHVLAGTPPTLVKHLFEEAKADHFGAKPDQTFSFPTRGEISTRRLVLLGLGSREKFTPELLRLALGRAARVALRVRAIEVAVALPDAGSIEGNVRAAVEGIGLGAYRFDRYKSSSDDARDPPVKTLRLLLPRGRRPSAALTRAATLAMRVFEATNWARDLVNEPAMVVTPSRLANEARKLAQAVGLRIFVGDRRAIQKERMGMFLGVARGSTEEPKLVHLEYRPRKASFARRAPLALVGKAITFDSGGLSLKTAEGMVDMKTDMAGAAAVLGAMRVVGHLKPPFPVHAFVGACENMPSGSAYRPGDILTSRLGKTVEITNTDAEGRLVLGDVLALANERKPAALIDLATLTGACVIALGNYITGVFGNDDGTTQEVLEAGQAAGEELWRLPIHEMQKDALKSEVADMRNSGERWGGAINAALFLREFVGDTPWVHLDIAGPSQSPKEWGYSPKGATGVGVRTLVELIDRRTRALARTSS